MSRKKKESNPAKKQLRSYHCAGCKQRKSCGKLDEGKKYCCGCYREILEELERDELLVSSDQQVLDDYRLGIIVCQCLGAEKPRIKYVSSDGGG